MTKDIIKEKTTVTLNRDELDKIINVFSWELDGYGEETIPDYNDYVDVARKFVKAQCRLLGRKYDINDSGFIYDDE